LRNTDEKTRNGRIKQTKKYKEVAKKEIMRPKVYEHKSNEKSPEMKEFVSKKGKYPRWKKLKLPYILLHFVSLLFQILFSHCFSSISKTNMFIMQKEKGRNLTWNPEVTLFVRLKVGGGSFVSTRLRMEGTVDPDRSVPRVKAPRILSMSD
jgi:hypothetical protein